jgi:hypothetical protein
MARQSCVLAVWESTQLLARNCDNQDMAEEEDKKQDAGDQPPPETILETPKQRDPDEAVFAEQAILSYAANALDSFRQSVDNALDAVMAWIGSQANPEELDSSGFTTRLGDAYLHLLLHACGGIDTPIGAALFNELDGELDQAVRNEQQASLFVNELARMARNFAWYMRDNLQAVLANQWDQLRDLAYEGSTDFIPALHAFGMPRFDWTGHSLQSGMIAVAESTRDHKPKTQDEAIEKEPEQEVEEQEQVLVEEEEKAQQAT